MDGGHRVSCILPAYNEAESLPATVTEWSAALARCAADYEIIVVDDGSTDDTRARLHELGTRHEHLRVVTHEHNLGYGVAIANGFAAATFPLLFFVDADGQYDPEDLSRLLEHVDAADLVIGYRASRSESGLRPLLSRGYNFLVRRVIGVQVRDINCAFKLMHRDVLRELDIETTGFAINAELAMKARIADLAMVEVPVRHRPRHAGRSKVRPRHVLSGLNGLIWLRRRRSALTWAAQAGAGAALPLGRSRDAAARR